MRGLLALGLGASPIVGGAVAAVIVLKLRKRRRNRQQGIDDDGNAGADEVGEEAAERDIDDPWPSQSKQRSGSRATEDLAEPLSTVVLDETLPIGEHDLWRLVMADPEFQSSVQKLNKHRELKVGRWHMTKDGGAERRVKYITSFKKQMIGPKEAQCIETHSCTMHPGSGWQVDVTVQTPKVPYGNTFHSHLRWLARSIDGKRTQLKISCEVVFTGTCLVKGVVKRASMEGMKESYAKYRVHLLEHLKVDSAGGGAAEPKQGNGGRQAGRLLLLLLLGALLTIAYFAITGKLEGGRDTAAHALQQGRTLLAAAAAGLRQRTAGAQVTAAAGLHALRHQTAAIVAP
ncbi:hypothetical protein COCSUDRAFT_44606 [Coccomyxa subellipsoidea C-169]|uniref:VASt domain-containing protein n=1 Tax=Coccomyxa subellipsoidea (strain C-169) TaxID=574566 RepID=I0YN26_COCSC|nr:hypothetical protein COCSUDRAFT_44606 [Coccomyxa subellipsoidea C-169]EIE19795.1 hypothetical protein COCSUDRAFT_44606 [Coccomyxa subellipsoidea C-169]|eukprot:XP_005644339.1 hypothetical protein COCSUDRAFT_44606 [Coccomyxa subellipsoidea C-169]